MRNMKKQPQLSNGHTYCHDKYGQKVCTGAGARHDILPENPQAPLKMSLQRLHLTDSGRCYDNGGAYHGANSPGHVMYIAFANTGEMVFTRAASRKEAGRNVLKLIPGAIMRGIPYEITSAVTFKALGKSQWEYCTEAWNFYLTKRSYGWIVDIFDAKIKDSDEAHSGGDIFKTPQEAVACIQDWNKP